MADTVINIGRVKPERVKLVSGMVTLMLIMLVAGFLFEDGCDMLMYPWAHSVTRAPTLTGSWLGRVNSTPPRAVLLTMQRPRSSEGDASECRECPTIEGWFRFCDATGASDPYRIAGDVGFWRGSSLKLWFPSGWGPVFSDKEIPGSWNQADVLTLIMQGRRSPRTANPPPETHSVVFHHATQVSFVAACKQLRQH